MSDGIIRKINIDDFQKTFVKQMLQEGLTEVVFTKVDGERRTIIGTTNIREMKKSAPEQFQEKKEDKNEVKRLPKPGIVRIFDVEKKGWRSFRVENMISFDKVKGD